MNEIMNFRTGMRVMRGGISLPSLRGRRGPGRGEPSCLQSWHPLNTKKAEENSSRGGERTERRERKAGASSSHSKRWREFVHPGHFRREAFGVRPGLPALSDATLHSL